MDGLNTSLALPSDERGINLPALQALTYQPRALSEAIPLCLSGESVDLLLESEAAKLGLEAAIANYGGDDVTIFGITAPVRWVVLGIPRIFSVDKSDGTYHPLERGRSLREMGRVTATRLSMLCVVGNAFLMADGGVPQVFTLKLTSSKTGLVEGVKGDDSMKNLKDLNKVLQGHYKLRGVSLLHLVSLEIRAIPKKFTSKYSAESSIGVLFILEGGARPLPPEMQKLSHEVASSSDVQAMLKDPFRLAQATIQAVPEPQSAAYSFDDVPF